VPLPGGKKNIGSNIKELQAHGHPHDQSIAIALDVARRKRRDDGGSLQTPKIKSPNLHTGPIHSSVAGRTDHLPIHVPSGSYVLPADIVSAGGEGNTIAGFKVLRRTFGGDPYGAGSSPYGQSAGPYGETIGRATGGSVRHRAAGILFLSPEKEVLLMRRAGKDHHGEWALPAGGIEKGETPEQAARRETQEEAGYDHEGGLSPFMHSQRDGVDFTTFIAHSGKFKPKLNEEHSDAIWIKPAEADSKLPLHPGVKAALDKLGRRVAKARGGEASGVPIVAAGGEWVIPPHHVEAVGGGDIDMGHRVLDEFVKRARKELIGTLQKLPGPKRD
jgi:8-oxo-dGTP pyrophosphatase MutT (NUDIX family)